MRRVVALIQARSTSKRLPDKSLTMIGTKTVIQRVYDRVNAVNLLEPLIDDIVVACPYDDPLVQYCSRELIPCYTGSEDDVLDRFYRCADYYNATDCVRICADCVFLEPVMVWGLIKTYLASNQSYLALGFNSGKIPGGWDAEIFSFKRLKRAWKNSSHREHISHALRGKNQDRKDICLKVDCKCVKLDLDTGEDLERLREYEKLL